MTENNTEAALDNVRAIERVGDLIVDQESGEILEWPADTKTDRWEWLAERAAESRAQENAWKSAGGFYRKLLLGYLDAEQLDSYTGDAVRFSKRNGRDSRWSNPERLPSATADFELTKSQIRLIKGCANRYNKKDIQALEERGKLPTGTAAALLSGSVGDAYAQVDRVRKEAPVQEIGVREGSE